MAEQSSNDGNKQDSEQPEQQQEEVDGTSFDPNADPRDPGRYYTFPHFAEEKREEDTIPSGPDTPNRQPGTLDHDPKAPNRSPGTSQDSTTTQTTPIPRSTSPSNAEAASPPFWPTSPSPLSKRLRPKPPSIPSPSVLQRRATTTSQASSPQVSRIQLLERRASAQVQASKGYSSPAARSLRSISAAQSPRVEVKRSEEEGKEGQSPVKKQQQKRLSSRSKGPLMSDRGKNG
ncbi:uncharacterized protein M437DRAFT_86822 [Aureobasidium melanogenum CBS 110374]|uniref:Uncharacterized protein n=1 Tax=Aureobasidium melanogenum (strain CBS 110374) TaxID=1043003 RepID=A0A074WCY6_AURM1|nr:uncharacterized protein M437DRAFT_86822 [Aureobasidium melanogenum CBS 110374]KEQ60356.1 hypothetical protein M437DRAFT_86822 [Aureobasidium melanogenum CBS 110374]